MDEVSVRIYGKINLSLKAGGTVNGYHVLDTVMASISVFDVVSVCPGKDNEFTVTFGETADGANSNAMKAAVLMRETFGIGGADIKITTGIPSGAGLGGSSADAAGVILALARLNGINETDERLARIAAKVGSDVPYMLSGGFARLVGTGTGVNRFAAPAGQKVLLAGKGTVNTGECFRAFDERKFTGSAPDNDKLIAALKNGDFNRASLNFINQLQPYASVLNPGISDAITVMKDCGLCACMTGSGSYSFGIGGDRAMRNAGKELKNRGFAVLFAGIVPSGIEFI